MWFIKISIEEDMSKLTKFRGLELLTISLGDVYYKTCKIIL